MKPYSTPVMTPLGSLHELTLGYTNKLGSDPDVISATTAISGTITRLS